MLTTGLRKRNRFAYPGVFPRFDPQHFMSANARACTAIYSQSRGVFDFIANKKHDASAGAPTSNEYPIIGFGVGNGCGRFTSGVTITAGATTPQTYGAIFLLNTLGANAYCVGVGSASGTGIGFSSTNLPIWKRFGGSDTTTAGYTGLINTPYFMAASSDNSSATNNVERRLDAGQLNTFTGGATNMTGSPAEYDFAGGNAGSTSCTVNCSMYAEKFHSLADLVMWSADPWLFWYPNR